MKKSLHCLTFIILFFSVSISSYAVNKPKYIFLFIGDGMGISQVALTEAYMASLKGIIGFEPLIFSKFPSYGLCTTYSANYHITCSSAAGTALATGTKTNNYMLGVDPDTNKLKSISYKLHEKGLSIGIISTVPLEQATPAAFYANNASRKNYYDISLQLPQSGFEFFGGGDFSEPKGKNTDKRDVLEILADSNYTIVRGFQELEKNKGAKKLAFFQAYGKDSEMPFAIDRKDDDLKLSDVVKVGIEHLYKNNKGFFMMAEGGKIDWAAHSNDAKTDILEIMDFADAVEVAYRFYLKHPNETLIIVTADHDTGGASLGRDKGGYVIDFNSFSEQVSSFAVDNETIKNNSERNEKANIGWTTTGHTGVYVPIYSIGVGSQRFSGRLDNTDIPKRIMEIMKLNF
ncbi:MAG: alkaline phosphatase [Rikenellaceae bacterium]|nr:alkaline phosphatase [Rikenellaceae bacterium]